MRADSRGYMSEPVRWGLSRFLRDWFLQHSGWSLRVLLSKHKERCESRQCSGSTRLLIPCWHPVSVIHTAVENPTAYAGGIAGALVLVAVPEKGALVLLQVFSFTSSFSKICLETTKTNKRLLCYNSPLCHMECVMVPLLLTVLGNSQSLYNLNWVWKHCDFTLSELREYCRIHRLPFSPQVQETWNVALLGWQM